MSIEANNNNSSLGNFGKTLTAMVAALAISMPGCQNQKRHPVQVAAQQAYVEALTRHVCGSEGAGTYKLPGNEKVTCFPSGGAAVEIDDKTYYQMPQNQTERPGQ